MKTEEQMKRYAINVEWSAEDECFVARVPAWKYLAAHGDTPESAVREAKRALKGSILAMRGADKSLPEPDLAAEDIRRYAPIFNVLALARRAGLNKHTLATKLKRGTRFSADEA